MLKFIEAVLILSGMIIGVGMFSIPFSFVRSGFWLGATELLFLTAVITVFHLLYGEIVLKTEGLHRLPGYVRLYLGERAALVAWLSAFGGILGTLLVYLIVGSVFLESSLRYFGLSYEENFLVMVLALLGALVTLFSLKKEAFINGILTALLISFIVFLSLSLFPKINPSNLTGFNAREVFFPYGILLFALSGGVVIPDLVTLFGKDRRYVRPAIITGTLVPALLYFIFSLAVVGSSGSATSPEAIAGLKGLNGEAVLFVGSLIGLTAVFTSLIVLEKSFQALLVLDLGFSKLVAWVGASFGALVLYFFGLNDFIAVIGAVGALAVGVDSALIIAAHKRAVFGEGFYFPWVSLLWRMFLYALILAGVIYELAFVL